MASVGVPLWLAIVQHDARFCAILERVMERREQEALRVEAAARGRVHVPLVLEELLRDCAPAPPRAPAPSGRGAAGHARMMRSV